MILYPHLHQNGDCLLTSSDDFLIALGWIRGLTKAFVNSKELAFKTEIPEINLPDVPDGASIPILYRFRWMDSTAYSFTKTGIPRRFTPTFIVATVNTRFIFFDAFTNEGIDMAAGQNYHNYNASYSQRTGANDTYDYTFSFPSSMGFPTSNMVHVTMIGYM